LDDPTAKILLEDDAPTRAPTNGNVILTPFCIESDKSDADISPEPPIGTSVLTISLSFFDPMPNARLSSSVLLIYPRNVLLAAAFILIAPLYCVVAALVAVSVVVPNAVAVTVSVIVGATVMVVAVIPQHEHALEYFTAPEQALA
jgi:hypothetical protein